MIDADPVLRPNAADISAQVFDDEVVVINFVTNVYYTIDGIGAFVWRQFESGCTAGDAASRVARRYGVSAPQASSDMGALVADLRKEQLLIEGGEPGAAPDDRGHGGTYAAPRLTPYRDMSDILALDPPLPELRPLPTDAER